MGHKSKKHRRKKNKAVPKLTFVKKLKSKWAKKYPILLFVLGFLALMALFFLFISTDYFIRVHPVITSFNATVSGALLNLIGQGITVTGSAISSPEFSINVAFGCDAIEPIAILASLILAFPVSFLKKIPGLLLGVLFLFVLNLIRIISLFLIGIYIPSAFDIMHIDVWQVLFILFAIAGWAFWIQWSIKKAKPE